MTVFKFEVGDRASVEAPSGRPRGGEVVDTEIVVDNGRPVPHVTVQVAENVRLQVPQNEATPP